LREERLRTSISPAGDSAKRQDSMKHLTKIFGTKEKGCYGHARTYKRSRLIMMLMCFAVILVSVVLSLIVLQTRKSIFVVVACVMSIPFARNLINYVYALKAKPLSREEYERVHDIERRGVGMLYDITITDTEGAAFYRCMAVYNNNVIALIDEELKDSGIRLAKDNLGNVNDAVGEYPKTSARLVLVNDIDKLEHEIGRLTEPKKPEEDERLSAKILLLGY